MAGEVTKNIRFINLHEKPLQVFYTSAEGSDCVYMFWTCNGAVSLSRIRFQLPLVVGFTVTDAVLCQGMAKMVAATQQGNIIVFRALFAASLADAEGNLAMEHVEERHINKKAHEVRKHQIKVTKSLQSLCKISLVLFLGL